MILSFILIYLLVAPASQRQKAIAKSKGFFGSILLKSFNFKVEYFGQYESESALVVSNNVSWIDVLLMAHKPNLHFVAKSEVKRMANNWFFDSNSRNTFIRRDNKFQVYRSLPKPRGWFKMVKKVMLFPEEPPHRRKHITLFSHDV